MTAAIIILIVIGVLCIALLCWLCYIRKKFIELGKDFDNLIEKLKRITK
jgi:hypothetical protein